MDNSSNGNRLLIVDASTPHVDALSAWLKNEDLQIFTADTGLQTLAKLEFLRPDIVVINVELPDMSGFDLCKKIKKIKDYILVLCVSMLKSDSNRIRSEEMGADDYFESGDGHYLFLSKIRSLVRVFRLSKQLYIRFNELQGINAILNQQMKMGMQVQRALIPQIDMQINTCTLLSRYYPAMDVSGDFYSVIPLSDDSFGIVMGDVSGHGIASAFVTALLNMIIKNIVMVHSEPDQLLFHLNNEVCGLFENSDTPMSATVFYGMVNTSTRVVRYANAGQSLPFYVDVKSNTVTELTIEGRPVGMLKDSIYRMKEQTYQPSDLLLFHTDGLQDSAYKEQPDKFTHEMKECLSDICNQDNMEEMLDIICENFYHVPDSEAKRMEMDDVSMILCKL